MAHALYTHLDSKRILVAGAGVTGAACARALEKRGSHVTIVDEKVIALEGFTVITPSRVDFANFDLLLVSPGWREDHPVVVAARAARIALINEVDLAWSLKVPGQKWLALTGTNGKTTTVELAAAMLRSGGLAAVACGNVGTTVIEVVESTEKYDYLVLELSSFQLHWLDDAEFVSSAVLNIAQDHLDWHGSFDAYASDKLSILDKSMTAILNSQDREIVTRTTNWQGRKVFFSLDTPSPGEMGVVEELLVDRAFVADPQEAAMICELVEVTPTVPHNVSNALAAAGLARTVGVSHEAIRSAITEFAPGRHRIETVLERDGVTWINDSKATNPHAASAAIMSALSVIWIAGGLAKGATMDELVERIKSRVRLAILMGEDRELIASALTEHAPEIEIIRIDTPSQYSKGGDSNALMEVVIRAAKERANSGDTVLLAPACASMDQFVSYSDRGDRFRAAVEKVVRDGK
jgi:UDP-N-acetylmuramoylalanine--D-glutamate ligase